MYCNLFYSLFSTNNPCNGTIKRRWSKARTHSKRSTWKLDAPKFTKCSNCGEPVLPHTLCSNCGYYDGKQVVAKKETENA